MEKTRVQRGSVVSSNTRLPIYRSTDLYSGLKDSQIDNMCSTIPVGAQGIDSVGRPVPVIFKGSYRQQSVLRSAARVS